MGFPGGDSGKEPAFKCRWHRSCRFDPWVGKIPWRRAWQPTLVFLPGESPWTEEPGGLQSMGSQRVGHNWSDLAGTPAHLTVASSWVPSCTEPMTFTCRPNPGTHRTPGTWLFSCSPLCNSSSQTIMCMRISWKARDRIFWSPSPKILSQWVRGRPQNWHF